MSGGELAGLWEPGRARPRVSARTSASHAGGTSASCDTHAGAKVSTANGGRIVFVLSDATGETAEKVVRAALLQFSNAQVQLRMYTRVRLEAEMRAIMARAKEV